MKKMSSDSDMSMVFSEIESILSSDEYYLLEKNISTLKYIKGENILKQGSLAALVLFLKSGVVKVVVESEKKKPTIVKIESDKNFIALPVLGNNDKYPFSVYAITDCEVCFIKKGTLVDLMNSNDEFQKYILNWF